MRSPLLLLCLALTGAATLGAQETFEQRLAAALDPNRETAYRYAGDALMHLHRPGEALEHFVSAVIAEPAKSQPI